MDNTKEFKSFFRDTSKRKANTWCNNTTQIDGYGNGCTHNCKYCYAKSLLDFRKLWNPAHPSVANIMKIKRTIRRNLHEGDLVRIGGMTDPFMPIEKKYHITRETIKELNAHRIHYIIVTKSDMVADDEYIELYDKELAHFQVTITTDNDELCKKYEPFAPPSSKRIAAVEKLWELGFDVAVRLSPFVPEFVDINKMNAIRCDKILIEFLKVNTWIKRWFDIDYSPYTLKYGGYEHLPLERKIELANLLTGYKERSVGEYVKEHHEYFSQNYNNNPNDCCNLRR